MAKPIFSLERQTVTRNLQIIRESGLRAYGEAMFQDTEEVETPECRARVPVDTGDLLSTIKTVGPVYRGKTVRVGTEAGGAAASGKYVDYAIRVHEDTEVYHPYGEAKYIERPYREFAPSKLERVARRVDLAAMTKRRGRGRR